MSIVWRTLKGVNIKIQSVEQYRPGLQIRATTNASIFSTQYKGRNKKLTWHLNIGILHLVRFTVLTAWTRSAIERPPRHVPQDIKAILPRSTQSQSQFLTITVIICHDFVIESSVYRLLNLSERASIHTFPYRLGPPTIPQVQSSCI